jgi:hypothetical protein
MSKVSFRCERPPPVERGRHRALMAMIFFGIFLESTPIFMGHLSGPAVSWIFWATAGSEGRFGRIRSCAI